MERLKGKNNVKGITLIALVITIIILLILAGVTIATLTGENGILSKVAKAKDETNKTSAEEKVKLEVMASYGENGELDLNQLNKNLRNIEGITYNGAMLTEDNKIDGLPATVIVDGEKVKINLDRTITTPKDMTKIEIEEVSDGNSTINGEEYDINNPIIPKGFKAVNEGEANWKEKEGYKKGLVIEDVTAGDDVTKGSQFVWVPVPNYNEFHLMEGYYGDGKLDSKLTGGVKTKPIKEAGSSLKEALPKNNAVIGTEESVSMYASVKKYKGFYIARYEAGVAGTNASTITNEQEKKKQDGSKKPVSKQNVGVWNFIPWGGAASGTASDGLVGNDNEDGAVKVARSMYNNNNTTVKSTLCYGVQWDATMKFVDSEYTKLSQGRGNYTNNIAVTGSRPEYAEKNIYDMAGNIYEWVMEEIDYTRPAFGSKGRVLRGGCFGASGNIAPASYRSDMPPDTSLDRIGFRVALYIDN